MYAFIGDIHLGTKLPKVDYLKSLDTLLDIIKKHKEPCEGIFVCGDIFDHRLTIDEAKFASLFLINLVCNQCGSNGKTNAPVRIIHGTYSHDYHQMEIFLPMLQRIDNVDVQYFDQATAGKLPNGKTILYLPQEYGDVDYTEALSHQYDIIIGHGPIASSVLSPCPSANRDIVLPVETLGDISKICVFGHYHEYTDFGNNVYYTGSMLRFRYGEPTKKVFFLCDSNFNVETIPNLNAMEYETFDVYSPEELRDYLSKEITNPHRFMIHTDNSDLGTYHAIMNVYKQNQFISYRIITNKISDEASDDVVQPIRISTSNEKPIPSLVRYISDRYDMDVSDQIHEYEERINRD